MLIRENSMAYKKTRINKRSENVYSVVHAFKQDDGSYKNITLFNFFSERECERKIDEIREKLSKDVNNEYLLSLLRDIETEIEFNDSIFTIFRKYVEKVKSEKRHDDDVKFMHIKSHLKRVSDNAAKVLGKTDQDDIMLQELLGIYSTFGVSH